ncbi:hypothetical protein BJ684DRAFT_17061 [Piptocephalis cylindrospora]|uniref:Uncharacterized protein n=1 Tax=Piptocephalis cylindrospora TaxID=1907219 RepID=A0A4P9Y0W5_9FUNG|nr:hypothetical protein BJ684DRAFT_17061 [Piptocephalis cylindrospora]|eukprot:RKP12456.1 hypothetical protein BJ684DRAFT_17061 [Piptocephalis cylindrospora]
MQLPALLFTLILAITIPTALVQSAPVHEDEFIHPTSSPSMHKLKTSRTPERANSMPLPVNHQHHGHSSDNRHRRQSHPIRVRFHAVGEYFIHLPKKYSILNHYYKNPSPSNIRQVNKYIDACRKEVNELDDKVPYNDEAKIIKGMDGVSRNISNKDELYDEVALRALKELENTKPELMKDLRAASESFNALRKN